MTDYSNLIDAETRHYLATSEAFFPEDFDTLPLSEKRRIYEEMCASFHAGYPSGVSAEEKLVDRCTHRIAVRRYRAMHYDAHAVVLYFHGGGFVFGSLDSHDDICAEICHRTGYEVLSVDYRLAPEHPYPAAFDDALAAFRWASNSYNLPILLAGDSAGACLAAWVSQQTRTSPDRPMGQVLIYPLLGGDQTIGSYRTHAKAPGLTTEQVSDYLGMLFGEEGEAQNGDALPLQQEDFSNLPPTVAITAQYDPLASDGETYCARIRQAGGKAWWHEEVGLVHGYLRARHGVARARESFSRITDQIKMLGKREWPHV